MPGGGGRSGSANVACLPLFEPREGLGLCRPDRGGGGGIIFGMELALITRGPSPG